jgi:hypothetical protein
MNRFQQMGASTVSEGLQVLRVPGDGAARPTQGCGSTGWASSSFTMGTAGSYFLLFGVTNWNDEF